MIATHLATKKRSIERASARCSRERITPTAVSVGWIGNSSCITPSAKPPRDLVAGVAERLDHPAVVGQRLGDELGDAALAAGLGQVLEQQLRQPTALVGVLDEEGDLGLA